MKLRTQLRISAALPAVFAVLIGGALLFATQQVGEARRQAEAADAIALGIFELHTLTQEYVLRGSERVVAQWRARHESLGQRLDTAVPVSGGASGLVASLRRDHADMARLFGQLAGTGAGAWHEHLAGQMLIRIQAMDSVARQLAARHHREVSAIQQRVDVFVFGAVVMLAVVLALIQLLLSRAANRCMGRLMDGIGLFAAGNLAHRVPPGGVAELDAIAASFNNMAGHLAESISLIKNLNQDLAHRATQLETANQDLEGFSYSVSHDLRTPLRAIDGFSLILLEDYAGRLDDEGRRLLNVVRDNTAKMSRLIDDILLFSRAGRLELALVEVDVEELVRSVWEEIAPTLGARNVRFEARALPRACGDHSALVQAVTNLLANAAKFTRPRDPAVIEVGGSEGESENIYYVRDNGVGFDMQYAHKLFGVFQRLHGVNEFEGTGIGLAIVKRVITKHGGRVWAEGKVNEGASFFFALPRREPCQGGKP